MIKTIVNGANGRMGSLAATHIDQDPQLDLVACCNQNDDLAACILAEKADVVVDFTTAECVYENAITILNSGARPVIGTTGLLPNQIKTLEELALKKKLGGIIAPNFSIGAVLLMRLAKEAAQYFSDVEIIEMHHDQKLDSPSGTALKTAEMIASAVKTAATKRPLEKETVPGARGAIHENIHIHAVRLPGLVAHETVLFGGHFETLSLRHDAIHRESFMPGVVLSVKKAMTLKKLVYGLEHIL